MNERMLQWLEEAEESATPVVEAEAFTPFSFSDLRVEEGLLAQIGREQWEELQWYLERHPDCRFVRVEEKVRMVVTEAGEWVEEGR